MTHLEFAQRERRKLWQEMLEVALFTILWLVAAVFVSMVGLSIKTGLGL